jgi:hypothetical protein
MMQAILDDVRADPKITARWLMGALLVAALLLNILWVAGTAAAGVRLIGAVQTAQKLLAAGPTELDADAVGELLRGTRRDTLILKQRVGWLAPLGPRFTWFPGIGPLLGQVPALLELGDSLTALGVLMWDDVAPLMDAYGQGAPLPALLPDVVANVSRELPPKLALAERAHLAYAGLDVQAFPNRFRGPLEKLSKALPLLHTGLELVESAPVLLGLDSPRSYLVLALNEAELRPSGGFITGVAEVRVANAELVSMVFRDSYAVDDFAQPYPDPPDAIRQLMGVDLWVFRDSNWSPDFPTAAQQAIALYRPGYPVQVDEVIGLDQQALSQLVGALGSVQIPGETEAVTGDTILSYMHTAWGPDEGVMDGAWWLQRKDFMGELAGAAMDKLMSGHVDYLQLMETAIQLLEERHLQIYTTDEAAARLFAAKGWDGGLLRHSPSGDFLAVVEANVGYNKASAQVLRRLHYRVDLSGAVPVSAVELRYENLNPASAPCDPTIRYDLIYENMMDRCYWAHVRLYTPRDSSLRAASSHPIVPELLVSRQAWSGKAQVDHLEGHTVFSQAFLLPRAHAETVQFLYELPSTVLTVEPSGIHTYRLVIHKQAGLASLDAEVALRLPGNAVVLHAHPQPTQLEDGVLVYNIVSRTDIELVLDYQVQED